MNKDVNIRQYIEDLMIHIPEDKRATYELILLRCGFCETDDPLFPIVLFLLFMQSSVTDSLKSVEERIENMPLSEGKESVPMTSKKSFIIGIICLVLFALCLFGAFLSGVSVKSSSVAKRIERQDVISRIASNKTNGKILTGKEQKNLQEQDTSLIVFIAASVLFILLLLLTLVVLIYLRRIEKRLSHYGTHNAVGETINSYLLNEQILKIKNAEQEKLKLEKEMEALKANGREINAPAVQTSSTDPKVQEVLERPAILKRPNPKAEFLSEQMNYLGDEEMFDKQFELDTQSAAGENNSTIIETESEK